MMKKYAAAFLFLCCLIVSCWLIPVCSGQVFPVHHKFKSRIDFNRSSSLSDYKAHDNQRHARFLSAVDLPLGGNSDPNVAGLYYTQIGIGTPPTYYHVIIDTGSDLFWVNCIHCNQCPNASRFGINLKLFDPKESRSATLLTCEQDFCSAYHGEAVPGCTLNKPCEYHVGYGDGSSTVGYLVNDVVWFKQVSGNLDTITADTSILFGCGIRQTGTLVSSYALDGILGFGASRTSFLSQLASTGKIKRKFAHCLDANNGGLFAIGDVVEPALKITPLLANGSHYNVILQSIQVGNFLLDVPELEATETIVDSGTTLAYLPRAIFDPLIEVILNSVPNLSFQFHEGFYYCFQFNKSISETFPAVTFGLQNSVQLNVYPRNYLIQYINEWYCLGWQASESFPSNWTHDMIILGELALSDKLIVYDLENQVIGLTEHNCSSSIKVKDEQTGRIFDVASRDISSGSGLYVGRLSLFFLLIAMLRNLVH